MKFNKLKIFKSHKLKKERKFIFIHIQKTAGKSIRQALGLRGGADHRLAKEIKAEIGDEEWLRSFSFCFVRNPWDRIASAYYYRKSGGNKSTDDLNRALIYPATFDEFCENINTFKALPNESMFISQLNWISDQKSKIIVDYIGRVENIQTDFDIICTRINKSNTEIKHLNKSRHKHFHELYNDNTKRLIELAYGEDIEAFKYTFK